MTKEQIEKRLGCPLEKLPMDAKATISVHTPRHKGTFDVLTVTVMQGYVRPYIDFGMLCENGRIASSYCFTEDYGLTWAASEDDWEFAKKWRNKHE